MSDIAERIALLPPEKRALLAARLARSERSVHGLQQIPIRERGVPAPLSDNQRSVWFLDQLYPGNVAYNSGNAVRFSGRLDPNALEWSWNELVRRHDLLRTVFELREGDAVQYAKPFRPVRLRRMELGQLPESERLEAAREEAVREAQEPFNLASGPPWRVKLLCCSEREHVLVVILHHIICDGWSIGVLVRELMAGYEAFLRGEPSPLPELPIQYADYAAWQREQLAGADFQRQVELWRKRLEGVTDLQLPLDKPRPAEPTFRGARLSAQLPPTLTESLRRIAHSEGATLFMVLLGAFKVLLSRYSGESDIIVGSQIANRERSELEGLIGFFANTQALRTDLSGDPTFLELLARVRDTALGAYDSQEVPFKKLVEELKPEKQLNRNAFFDIDFNFRNLPLPTVNLPDLNVDLLRIENGTSKFDLSIEIAEIGSGLDVAGEYSTELFDASTPARLLKNYQTLLEGIVANPKRKISQLPLLTEAERHQILVEWNQTTTQYLSERCIHELFEEQVKRTPETVAVIFEDQQLSYQELNCRTNRLAHYLIKSGVKPGSFVGIMLERSIDMIVAILATLKAGAAYLPLDSEYPQARLTQILTDAMPTVVLSSARLCRRLPETLNVLELDAPETQIALGLASVENPTHSEGTEPLQSNNPAYLIYTSGSTGTPKGVVIEHVALLVYSQTVAAHYELSSTDRVMQFASLSFDAAVEEILPTLIVGASLVMRGSEIWTSWECRQKIRELGITVINLPTAYWGQLVQDWANEEDDLSTSVRLVLVGGEAMRPQSVGLWRRTPLRAARLLNTYGPTEATVVATTFEVPPEEYFAARVPVGKPLPGRLAYILDDNLEPVPEGVRGELYLGGKCLARGYLNQPKLTAGRFVADSHSADPEARMYKTGDWARWLPDGNIEFIGRSDNQVKIRGFRIEPGEVEALLRHHAGIRDAVVVAREDEPGQRHLAAYIVSRNGSAPEDLRSFLEGKLPSYMIPQAFVELDALPMTTSGKVDRKALPKPERQLQGYRAPRTPEEGILCGIYADLLSLERVGIDDNFFSLGGHSLLAMRLVGRMRSAFGVELALRAVFEAPTISELASRLPGAEKARAPVLRRQRPERLPLSYAQHRIWFLDQLEGSTAEYNLRETLRLEGELSRQALEQALQALVDRHESLRTRFDETDGEPFQVIEAELPVSLAFEDLSHPNEAEREQAIAEAVVRELRDPFDLKKGPLLRARLFKLGEREHILLVMFHHIVTDGLSMGVFNRELGILYGAFCSGRKDPLEPLSLQYPDYALWQRSPLRGEELERLLAYWRSQLADVPTLELPNDRPRPPRQIFAGEFRSVTLSKPLCEKLRTFSRSEGATMSMLILAAFKLLLHRLSGQDDITVGSPVAGRNNVETESLIGLFVNTLVLHTNVCGNPTFRQLLARVRKTALEAYAHQEAPFEKLVEVLNPERSLNRHPIFEVLFNYLKTSHTPPLRIPGLSAEFIRTGNVFAKFSMTLYVEDAPDDIALKLVYQSALFSPERMGHFLDQLEHLIVQLAEDPDRPIQAYSLVTETARRLLPDPTISLGEPEQLPVPRQFLSVAESNPSQTALCQGSERWTYQQLASSATKIANVLTIRGVQPGDVVAVSGPCSLGLISGIMGVLIARGVVLMLDSALPSARRDLMLRAASGGHWLRVGGTESATEEWSEDFQSLPLTRISCEGECAEAQSGSVLEGIISAQPEDPAYVFFTSGTTGVPEGILGTHKGLSHFLQWERQILSVSSGDRVAQLTGLSFDVVLRDIFLPLTSGATLCLPDSASASSVDSVVPWLLRERITILHTVPSLANAWLDGLESPMPLPDLRWVLFAGEPLAAALVHRWRERMGTAGGIFNLYGPTETTLAKCAYRVPLDPSPGVQPIGSPLPETQALIINQANQLCGIGEPGEIVIRTPFRTLGYLSGPAIRTGFTPNPFREDRSDIVYRTGDIGILDCRGLLLISGRLDDQIKIRGSRVEPSEIAAALVKHPDIRQSAVVLHEETSEEKFLVAYVLAEPTRTLAGVRELRSFLRRSLPDYMIPAFFVGLEKLPLTANGKLDRRALPAPDIMRLWKTQGHLAPRDPTERALANLWSKLLKVDEVGVQEDFFELGGHSLTATRLASRIRREFNLEIPLRAIFENPTIEALALQIAKGRAASIAFEDIQELFRDLKPLPEEAAEGELIESEKESSDPFQPAEADESISSSFACPQARSKFFGARQCNLVIVINERFNKPSFEKVAAYVREFDPSITALVTEDESSMELCLPENPSLIFSPALIRDRPRIRGRFFCGYPHSKSEEYVALEKAGIPVPKWSLLSEDHFPDLSAFDDYIVKKPDNGGRGAEVKIVRKSRVKWKPVTTRSAGTGSALILQRFIYTGPRPVCYRVNTLFGKVLYSTRHEVRDDQPAWTGPGDTEFGGRSIVASAQSSKVELNYEEDIIRFGEWAHSAFPEIPLLGFDIVREVPSGNLFVLEANAIGYVWNFYTGQEASYGFLVEQQFDGVRKAAYILAEKTQQSAI